MDPTAESRKKDHIQMAFQSQVGRTELDGRFYYEPMLAAHPEADGGKPFPFLGKMMKTPIWVSSMTGGTGMARRINHHLARACGDFGMGMGLGSCRQLLESDEFLPDFDVRDEIGDDLPLFANLGIAQIEQLFDTNRQHLILELLDKLRADGLIAHINPMQEWLQPEGDRFRHAPLETIKRLLDLADFPVIVKEVGQGFGKESMRALLQLPIAAIDFAANGGTNFAKLELLRSDETLRHLYAPLAHIGHSATDMVGIYNESLIELGDKVSCREAIISGGIRNFLDGYYLCEKIQAPAIYGQASQFLKYATEQYDKLYHYTDAQVKGLELAKAYLKVRR